MAAKDPSAVALYEQAVLATGLQPIITFDVGHFPLPSPVLCAQYTGVRLPIQEVIKQSESGIGTKKKLPVSFAYLRDFFLSKNISDSNGLYA